LKREWQNAVEHGDAAALAAMLGQGEDVDSRDRYGQTALMLSARSGHDEAVEVLLAHGAALDHAAKYGLTALMLAAINDRVDVVRLLVAAGANKDLQGSGAPGFAGKTALDLAIDLRREDIADILTSEDV
jgi:ankyrin repeat protein